MSERRKGVKNVGKKSYGIILFLVGKKIDKFISQPVILSEEDRMEAMSGSAGEAF